MDIVKGILQRAVLQLCCWKKFLDTHGVVSLARGLIIILMNKPRSFCKLALFGPAFYLRVWTKPGLRSRCPSNQRQEKSTLDRSLTPLILDRPQKMRPYRASVLHTASSCKCEAGGGLIALPAPPCTCFVFTSTDYRCAQPQFEPCGAALRYKATAPPSLHSTPSRSHAPQGRRRQSEGSHDP